MGHKSRTQQEDTTLIQGIIKDKKSGIYRVKIRVPSDLRGHPYYKGKEFIRKSLSTRDPREANRKGAILIGAIRKKEELLRSEVAQQDVEYGDEIAKFAIPVVPVRDRKTTGIEDRELDRIWANEYERQEKLGVIRRSKFASYTEEERENLLGDLAMEQSVISADGVLTPQSINWQVRATYHLEVNGISPEEVRKEQLEYLAAMLRRVQVEVLNRHFDELVGRRVAIHDELLDREYGCVVESRKAMLERVGIEGTNSDSRQTGPLLEELCNDYIERQNDKGLAPETVKEAQATCEYLKCILGANYNVAELDRAVAKNIVDFISTLPNRVKIDSGGESFLCRVNQIKQSGEYTRTSERTYLKKLGEIKSIFLFAARDYPGVLEHNPFNTSALDAYIKKSTPNGEGREKVEFTIDHLNKLFRTPLYTGHSEGSGGWKKPGDILNRDTGRYWAPLLMLFHGCRMNEAAQLMPDDVDIDAEIPCFRVSKYFGISGKSITPKRTKTKGSERIVPLHEEIIKCGFLEFVRARKLAGNTWLFPEWADDKIPVWEEGDDFPRDTFKHSKRGSDHCSKLIEMVIPPKVKPRPNNHSYRHIVRTAFRKTDVSDKKVEAIQGWNEGKKKTSEKYGEYPIEKLKEAIDKISYEGLDISHLYVR